LADFVDVAICSPAIVTLAFAGRRGLRGHKEVKFTAHVLPAGVAVVFLDAAALARPVTWHDGEELKLVDWELFVLVVKRPDHERNQIVVSEGVPDLPKSDRDRGKVGVGRSSENARYFKCSR